MQNNHKFGSLYDSKSKNKQKTSNLFEKNSNNLFFEPFNNPIVKNDIIAPKHNENQKFLNDIDSTLIMENVDNSAQNKVVKIDLKLKTLAKHIERINEELKLLELFNLEKDKDRRIELTKLKQNLILQMSKLKSEKTKYGIIYILAAYTNNKVDIDNTKVLVTKTIRLLKKYYANIRRYIKRQKFLAKLFKTGK